MDDKRMKPVGKMDTGWGQWLSALSFMQCFNTFDLVTRRVSL